MKVIIQDINGNEFLGANGCWVSSKDRAKDFFTLLRAYNFAQANTSVRFRVVLHCPEDGYSTSIVEGIGMAEVEDLDETIIPVEIHEVVNRLEYPTCLSKGFDLARIHLN